MTATIEPTCNICTPREIPPMFLCWLDYGGRQVTLFRPNLAETFLRRVLPANCIDEPYARSTAAHWWPRATIEDFRWTFDGRNGAELRTRRVYPRRRLTPKEFRTDSEHRHEAIRDARRITGQPEDYCGSIIRFSECPEWTLPYAVFGYDHSTPGSRAEIEAVGNVSLVLAWCATDD